MIDDLEREFLRLFLSSLKFLYRGKKEKSRVEDESKDENIGRKFITRYRTINSIYDNLFQYTPAFQYAGT